MNINRLTSYFKKIINSYLSLIKNGRSILSIITTIHSSNLISNLKVGIEVREDSEVKVSLSVSGGPPSLISLTKEGDIKIEAARNFHLDYDNYFANCSEEFIEGVMEGNPMSDSVLSDTVINIEKSKLTKRLTLDQDSHSLKLKEVS